MIEKCESLQLCRPLFHGTSAILQSDDYLYPRGRNAVQEMRVFATTSFPKAAAVALLSKRGLQNKTIGQRYYHRQYSYCYLFDKQSQNLILHPSFHWDDGAPTFVYNVDPTSFINHDPKGDEYKSYMPARINQVAAVITPEFLREENVGLYIAKSENALADLQAIYSSTVKEFGLRREIMDALCARIV